VYAPTTAKIQLHALHSHVARVTPEMMKLVTATMMNNQAEKGRSTDTTAATATTTVIPTTGADAPLVGRQTNLKTKDENTAQQHQRRKQRDTAPYGL
jgi:hypothetical protein